MLGLTVLSFVTGLHHMVHGIILIVEEKGIVP